MTEAEFIKIENDKIDAKWRGFLRKVDKTGETGRSKAARQANERLWINGFIQFGGPRKEIGNPYNCYRLTDKGRYFLLMIEGT